MKKLNIKDSYYIANFLLHLACLIKFNFLVLKLIYLFL